MKALNIQSVNPIFSSVFDVIAESLGRPPARTAMLRAKADSVNLSAANSPFEASADEPAHESWFVKACNWLWQRQMRGVDAYVARADDLFAALDRWLWKQRTRQTEAWLAKSQDLFELEARIRHLERGPQSRIF
ncbi:MAG: hypothetical protein ABI569_06535 [Casimicrobiaceae bacterium]